MHRHEHETTTSPGTPLPSDSTPHHAEGRTPAYHAPEFFVIGKAVDLVQGYSSGKYSDGYTGYYWER
jgi:hypothetical protein